MKIELKGINKSFGTKHVLKDLSFTANAGSAFGLLGRNGSGKTTTIRILMRIFLQDSGEVFINGKPNSEFKGKIGYLPEERGLYPKRVISEQMAYIGELRGMKPRDARESAQKLLKKFEAEEYYKKRLDTLSKGNQQKIQLAIALINDPDIVVLDEPFSGLDPVNARLLKDAVKEIVADGKTLIFSSHQMSYVEEFCNEVCIIDNGQTIINGNLNEIKKSYPRNRLMITAETGEGAKSLIESLKASSAGSTAIITPDKGHSFVVELSRESDKSELLKLLSGCGVPIDSFSVIEPSLEEIFVEKVGNNELV